MLIAVSSPWASEKFTGPIADLAKRLESDAIVAHVANVQEEDEHESDATNRGEQTLKLLTDGLREAGVPAEGVMLFSDDTAKAILNTARARECSIIVLGLTWRHASGIRRMLNRLIAADVPGALIRQTELPVLLLPASWSQNV